MADNCIPSDKKTLLLKRKIHLDDVFKEYIGEGGKYRIFLVFTLSLSAFCSFHVFGDIIWVTDIKSHWCALPSDADPSFRNLSLDDRINMTIPWIKKDNKEILDSCRMYDLNYSSFQSFNERNFSNEISTVKCSSWEFDTSEMKNTIVEQV